MRCPVCKGKTHVINSRVKKNNIVKRRRECEDCLTRFDTLEKLVFESIGEYYIRHLNKQEVTDHHGDYLLLSYMRL
jgi:transcriptional regulator NrdR family protein